MNHIARDLFGHEAPAIYPDAPGAKGVDGTSQAAAAEIEPHVSRLRRIAMQTLAELGEATPIEASTASGVAKEALQPRLSECRRMGFVEPTGARRRNPSGKAASVLRLTPRGREIVNNLDVGTHL